MMREYSGVDIPLIVTITNSYIGSEKEEVEDLPIKFLVSHINGFSVSSLQQINCLWYIEI
jgi:hypothetical protein